MAVPEPSVFAQTWTGGLIFGARYLFSEGLKGRNNLAQGNALGNKGKTTKP
jgi:hypothetical protein